MVTFLIKWVKMISDILPPNYVKSKLFQQKHQEILVVQVFSKLVVDNVNKFEITWHIDYKIITFQYKRFQVETFGNFHFEVEMV